MCGERAYRSLIGSKHTVLDPRSQRRGWAAINRLLAGLFLPGAVLLAPACASNPRLASNEAYLGQSVLATSGRSFDLNTKILQSFASRPGPTEYTIGPGDLVEISVLELDELKSVTVRVPLQGVVSLPLIGQVRVAGLTGLQLEEEVRGRVRRYMQNPMVSIFLRERRSWQVTVLGAVKNPGSFTIDSRRTVLDMLALAGGLQENAEPLVYLYRATPHPPSRTGVPAATLEAPEQSETSSTPNASAGRERPQETMVVISLDDLLANPEIEANIFVEAGDVLHVPKAGTFYVSGAVARPGSYNVDRKLTVEQAIILAGGTTFVADASDIKIYRDTGGPERLAIPVDFNAVAKGGVGPLVAKNDVIVVGKSTWKQVVYGFFGFVSTTIGFGPVGVGSRGIPGPAAPFP